MFIDLLNKARALTALLFLCICEYQIVYASEAIPFGQAIGPIRTVSQVYMTSPWETPSENSKWIKNLREYQLPLGFIPLARRYQRVSDTAISERSRQWAEIVCWRFQSDPKYSSGPLKYTIKDFEAMFQQFAHFGWNRDSCEQVLIDMGISQESSEIWCSNVEPWGYDECADLSWVDFVLAGDIEDYFQGKLELQAICRLVQLIRPSQLPDVKYRYIYEVCQQNILALRDPLTAQTVTEEDAEIICNMMDFTLSENCKQIPPKQIKKARDLAVAFGEEVYPRLMDFRVNDACKVLVGMQSDGDKSLADNENIEFCRNEMIKTLWERAEEKGDLLCPWGWDIISQFVGACQEVFKKHAKRLKDLEENAVVLTRGFFNPSHSYNTRWWKTSVIGQKLAALLAQNPTLNQSIQEGILSPTQLMWATNIHEEYKNMGHSVYSLIEVVNMVRRFDANEPQKSCESLLNLYLGKFIDNNENLQREQFTKAEVRAMCSALERQSIEICRKYLVSPLIGVARDVRSYFLKEMHGNSLMQLEDICLFISALNIPKLGTNKHVIERKCSHAMNKFILKTVNLTFAQRYGLTSSQQSQICQRMDVWSLDKCEKLPERRRSTIFVIFKKLYDLSSRYGILEYRIDEMCNALDNMGDNPPREKCQYIIVSEFFSRWSDSSNSLMQLARQLCHSLFERRTTGRELNELTKAMNLIKDFMDQKGEYAFPYEEKTYQQIMDERKKSKTKVTSYELLPSLSEGSQVEAQPGVLSTLESVEESFSPGIEDIRGQYYSKLTTIQMELLNKIISHRPETGEKRGTVEQFAKVIYKLNQFNVLESCAGQLQDEMGYTSRAARSICATIDPLQSDSCMAAQRIDLTAAKLIHQKLAAAAYTRIFINLSHICEVVNHVNILKFANKVRLGRMNLGGPACRNAFKTIMFARYLHSQSSQLISQLCNMIDITSNPQFNGGILKTIRERYLAFKLADSYGHKLDLLPPKKQHPISWTGIMNVIRKLHITSDEGVTKHQCSIAMKASFGKFKQFSLADSTEACCIAVNCKDFVSKSKDFPIRVNYEQNELLTASEMDMQLSQNSKT
ncbi:hypothetical protein ACR3K2_01600 [Cryptosporidium serpentis]